ncbi:pyridoxamine 5'-phosphate oxidase family protein [Streptomyces sp. NPDC055955]|uniref:pyridoxamine 5'-phosphate oxidase family protein n=1 Tax=Streptomyces sp. NPDC055955 TaxID=3345665 RepID=UPI0035D75A6A
MQNRKVVHRSVAERKRDTFDRLATERDVWVATAHCDHGPHQVPLWFAWDGKAVWVCTSGTSATVRNVRKDPRVRLSLPDTFDVVLLQGTAQSFTDQEVPTDAAGAFAGKFGWDPRTEDDPFVYLKIEPKVVRAWRGEPELSGRVIMRDGAWLE